MFKLRPGERQVPVDDVVAFIDLMHRWPSQTALKFAYEFYHSNLVVRWVDRCLHENSNFSVVISGDGMWYEQNQAHACANLDRLVYLRKDIERIEAQNPMYTADVSGDVYDDFPLGKCTKKNAAQLAPEILHILQNLYWDYCGAEKKPFPHPHIIKMWLQGDTIFHTDLSMPGPKKDWRVRPKNLIPLFKKDALPVRTSVQETIDYARLEKFVAAQKEQGVTDDVELGFMVLQIEPEISNTALVRLLHNITITTKNERDAARQRGMRLYRKIVKRYTLPK